MRSLLYLLVFFICISCTNSDDGRAANQFNDPDPVEDPDPDPDPDPMDDPDPDADYQLLFVGNSLTIQNNLPQLVKDRAADLGISVEVTDNSIPGTALEDHWNAGTIQGLISSGFYDYVIVQQGPSSQPYGATTLIAYGALIKELCDASGTELAFFMVWPSIDYFYTFPGVINSYTQAAQQNDAILCPVGSHWLAYIENTDDYSYYGSDGFHPSLQGSTIAAQIIVESLQLQ